MLNVNPLQWPWRSDPYAYLDYQKNWECDSHNANLHWRDICGCGWEISATNTIGDTSVYNACACNGSQVWATSGTTVITATGPAQQIDTILLWGNNIKNGSIDSEPYGPLLGFDEFGEPITGPLNVGGGLDCPCLDDGDCGPIAVDFYIPPDEPSAISSIQITIESDGPICISRMLIGQKLPITFDPVTFQNPHLGTDFDTETKESSCGILQQECKRVEVPLRLTLPCVPIDWAYEVWRCYLLDAKRNGVWLRWSLNNYGRDLFVGRLEGRQPQPQWADTNMCSYNLQLNAQGNITQPPCKSPE